MQEAMRVYCRGYARRDALMDRSQIEALLNDVKRRRPASADALERLQDLPFEDLGFAKLDHHRALRTGMPEVIFAAGKTTDQVARIFAHMAKAGGNVLATRASRECFEAVTTRSRARVTMKWHARSRSNNQSSRGQRQHLRGLRGNQRPARCRRGRRDRAADGQRMELIADVGVAGIHRLLAQKQTLQSARVLIVCAGMEGALPTVVAAW